MNDYFNSNQAPWGVFPLDVTSPLPSQRCGSSSGQNTTGSEKQNESPKADQPPPPRK